MDRYQYNLTQFANVSGGYAMLGTDNFSATFHTMVAAKAGYTVYVQRIVLMVTTDNAATQTFQDTAGTQIVAGAVKASPGVGMVLLDFGPEGFPLTEGKGLDHKNSGAGLAASVTFMAYQKKTANN